MGDEKREPESKTGHHWSAWEGGRRICMRCDKVESMTSEQWDEHLAAREPERKGASPKHGEPGHEMHITACARCLMEHQERDARPWLPEGAIEKATLDPRTAIVLFDGEGGTWTVAALAGLAKLYPEMAAMLRELEWAGGEAVSRCPACGARPERVRNVYFERREVTPGGHTPGCPLNALLNRVGR